MAFNAGMYFPALAVCEFVWCRADNKSFVFKTITHRSFLRHRIGLLE
jgi:hypothetical protein